MNELAVALFYLYVVLFGALDIGAFYYTYRITKVVGVFRGWILMLAFVAFFAFEGAIVFGASTALTIFDPSRINTYLQSAAARSGVGTDIYSILLAGLLFSAMFELHRTFKRLTPKPAAVAKQ